MQYDIFIFLTKSLLYTIELYLIQLVNIVLQFSLQVTGI